MASLIGTGPSFPYNVSNSGGLEYISEIDKINQGLFILFETPIGARLMLPEFGSSINKYRFDPIDSILLEKLRYAITEDIKKWEPRISLTSIEFLADSTAIDNSTVYISITYKVISTNVSANYVYPYKLEAYSESYE